jgi:hypothetical protein
MCLCVQDDASLTPREKANRVLNRFDPVAAFIVFQYSESMARCVEDFDKYSSFPYNLCYPQVGQPALVMIVSSSCA